MQKRPRRTVRDADPKSISLRGVEDTRFTGFGKPIRARSQSVERDGTRWHRPNPIL